MNAAQDELAQRGLALGLLARGLKYPDKAFREALAHDAYQKALLDALETMRDEEVWAEALSQLRQALRQASADPAALEGEYTYLFARNVATSPYASSYGGDRLRGMSELASFYAAFGFKVAEGGELPDHAGVELEFLAILCAKEAYAREQGWVEQAEICCNARRKFVTEHLAGWVDTFARRLQEQARHPFYSALASVASHIVKLEGEG